MTRFNSKLVRLEVEPKQDFHNWCEVGFNSKLVRLEGYHSLAEKAHITRFNSKLVRLKEDCLRVTARYFGFQFQTGSIKSLVEISFPDCSDRFNSKLVRLEADVSVFSPNKDCCFNSKLVRLEACQSGQWCKV